MIVGRRIVVVCVAALPVILQGNSAFAQVPNPQTPPYAQMDPNAVDYRGPGRAPSSDITGKAAVIGILLALHGNGAEQGHALLKAAQQAITDENKNGPLADGRSFSLAVRNEAGSWGQSSSEMIRLISEDQSLALIIGTDGNLAHQAEQIANKLGVPIVTLASDATTTEINIPWIFRVVPSDRQQAEVIAQAIHDKDKTAKVLLITTNDHDGRVGKAAFLQSMRTAGGAAPVELDIDPEIVDTGQARDALNSTRPSVVVFWTDSLVFEELLDTVQRARSVRAIYASEKSAQPLLSNPAADAANAVIRVPMLGQSTAQPGVSERVYNAVRLIAAAIRAGGPNRARVRDALARSTVDVQSESAPMFDGAGNLLAKPQLIPVDSGAPSPRTGSGDVR